MRAKLGYFIAMKKKRKTQVDTGIVKATIILVLKSGEVISGLGTFEGVRDADGNARFTANLIKPIPKNTKS